MDKNIENVSLALLRSTLRKRLEDKGEEIKRD